MGASVSGKTGIPLLMALKREKLDHGPYPHVCLTEAANRIMSDLVILAGVKALLQSQLFPFASYTVEFGNEDRNGHDIRAAANGAELIGEAFNVAPSLFQGKKVKTLRKMAGIDTSHKVIVFNSDAVSATYMPRSEDGVYFVITDIEAGTARILAPATTAVPCLGT